MKPGSRFLLSILLLTLAPGLARAADHFVILGGLGGEPGYAQRFGEQVAELETICQTTAGEDSSVHALHGNAATRENVKNLMERLAQEVGPDDALLVFLIGHGSFDGHEYKFNIPGPDFTAGQLKNWLDAIPARDQLVANMTSSSGASIEWLNSDRRVVITATKSGRERTITVFPEFWLEGLKDPTADTDKNDIVTALEAFNYAERKVKEFYDAQKRLATEHARLEGGSAANFTLARFGSAEQAAADPAARGLLAEREGLEREIASLRRRKADLPAEEYENQLEKLLIALARVQARIDSAAQQKQ